MKVIMVSFAQEFLSHSIPSDELKIDILYAQLLKHVIEVQRLVQVVRFT